MKRQNIAPWDLANAWQQRPRVPRTIPCDVGPIPDPTLDQQVRPAVLAALLGTFSIVVLAGIYRKVRK